MNFISDIFYIWKGKWVKENSSACKEYTYGFLVHSRGYKDIYRKYPKLRWVPKRVIIFVMSNLWPITLSRITGLTESSQNQKEIPGYVFGITMTAEEMMRNRPKALKKIRQALYLARGRGVRLVGLGGLTASLSGGGKELLDIPIHITTGHAYTAYNIVQNLFKITELSGVPKEKLKVAVVGAAGSVGSLCALLIARAGYPSITLIDLKRKHDVFEELQKEMHQEMHSEVGGEMHSEMRGEIHISDSLSDITSCDIVITATNTPEALIKTNHVHAGQIFIDDAQPSDIHPDVLKMPDVLVIEAGVVHTPGIKSNFNYGLKSRTDNFCCMAELLILASQKWEDNYVIHRATIKQVDEISRMGLDLGFEVAAFQNFLESVSPAKIEHVNMLLRAIHSV